ncbi:MAG: hypothetical protein JSV88_04860 [Candidatus Aminicenantes bacterium]|nr:MAG: hypothetical protein JSV88_04860 [Candidatus Aminicenantes bacterium]
MKLQTILIVIVLIIAWFFTINAFSYQAEKEFNLNLQAEGIEMFEIDCGAGYLKVKGVEGLKQIEVDATLVTKGIDDDDLEEFKNKYVKLKLEQDGKKARLISEIKSGFSVSSLFKRKEARINLEVRIPKNLDLEIDDGSGSIEISDVNGNVKLDDGSGSIEVANIKGWVNIEDGSGTTIVENIGGKVTVNDGSGTVKITDVEGDVDVDDSSGTVSIYNIKGSVVVDDGSGGIVIDGVDKDVYIKSAGSGSLTIRNVKGKVTK